MGTFGTFLFFSAGLGVPLAIVASSFVTPDGIRPDRPAALAASFSHAASDTIHRLPDDAGRAPSRVTRDADGLFYVGGRVNGQAMRFVIDSGASVMVLTERDALAAGIMVGPDEFRQEMATVGGNSQVAWAHIKELAIAGYRLRNLDVAIVKGDGSSLLGQNALRQLGRVVQDRDTMTLL